jgi:quinol monooxygenase YgiN
MILVVSKALVKEGEAASYKKCTERLLQETRKEAGCIAYDLFEDINNPNILTFVEKWESREHLEVHFNTPHFKEIVPQLQALREEGQLNIYREA